MTIKRITWQEAVRTGDDRVFVVSLFVFGRERPWRLHSTGGLLSGIQSAPRRDVPRIGEPNSGEILQFARPLLHGSLFAYDATSLLVHESLVPKIIDTIKCDMRPSVCRGIYDVDVLDFDLMTTLTNELPTELPWKTLCKKFGTYVTEKNWYEIVTLVPGQTRRDNGTVVERDFVRDIEGESQADGSDIWVHPLQPRAWFLEDLKEYGLLFSQGFVMRLDVAMIMRSIMPSLFWHYSYWVHEL